MTTSKNAAKELPISDETEELDATVPQQKAPKAASVTSIKKDQEPDFYGEDDDFDGGSSLVQRAKRLAKNKRVIAGAVTTGVLTLAVLVIRKRNTVEDEQNETPSEA
jgi:cell division protein FtsL